MIVDRGVVAGNVYDKYGTRNPIARAMMNRFLRDFRELASRSGCDEVHEIGCGEGNLALILADLGMTVRGSDVSEQVIEQAQSRTRDAGASIDLRVADVYNLTPDTDAADLIVCCEVLEHLPDPASALNILSRLARQRLLVSVPREPIWRVLNMARGKYLFRLGNTPGHVNHWSKHGFLRFLERTMIVEEVRNPPPWTMALCRPR